MADIVDPFQQAAAPTSDIVDPFNPAPVTPKPESGYGVGLLRSGYRGVAEIGETAGQALEYNSDYLASGDSTATRDESKLSLMNKAGRGFAGLSRKAKDAVDPAEYGTNEIKRSVFQGVESAPVSLAYKIPGYAGALAGGALGLESGPGALVSAAAGAAIAQAPAAAVMYRSSAQQNMEELDKAQEEGRLNPGVTNAEKLDAAQKMAHQEWIGESVSDVAENVMFSKLPFLGAAVKSAKGVLTPGLKSFAKTYAGVWVAEQAGEGYTAGTQAAIKNELLPADQQQTPWQAVKEQAGPTTVMTLLFAGAGHGANTLQGAGITKYLQDETTSPDTRLHLAAVVAERLKESNSPEAAQNFMDHAADAIANPASPYALDLNNPKLLEPYKPEKPETQLEQSGQDALDALNALVNPDNDIKTAEDAVAHVTETKAAEAEAEAGVQTASEQLAEKLATPIPEPAPQELSPDLSTGVDNFGVLDEPVDVASLEPIPFDPKATFRTMADAQEFLTNGVGSDGFVAHKISNTYGPDQYGFKPERGYASEKSATKARGGVPETHEVIQRPSDGLWVRRPKELVDEAQIITEPVAPHAPAITPNQVKGSISVYNVDANSALGYDSDTGVYTLREKGSDGAVDVATYEAINGKIQNFKTDATSRDGFDREQQILEAQALVERIEAGRGGVKFAGVKEAKNVPSSKAAQDLLGDPGFHLRPATERLAAINSTIVYPDGATIPQGSLKVSKNSTLQNQLSKIAGVFGHDVTLMADFPGRRGDGFWHPSDPKHVYIYETGSDKPLAVLGHELLHQMSTQDNALYKELGAGLYALRDNTAMGKYLDRYFPDADKSSVSKRTTEEWVADVLGHSMGNQGFWDEFSKASPSLAARVARFIHELIQKFKDKLFSGRIASSAKTVKDFKAVDKLAADVMTRYAQRLKKAAVAGDAMAIKELSAWHGSPHDHDKFDMSKVGTGEGAQAYGYGLYFAGSRDVAEWYRKKLANSDAYALTINGKTRTFADATVTEGGYLAYLINARGSALTVKSELEQMIRKGEAENNPNYANKFKADLELLNSWLAQGPVEVAKVPKKKGKLYQVELAPAEDEYLLWDKPLSEQSEKVKAALKSTEFVKNKISNSTFDPAFVERHLTGMDVVRNFEQEMGDKAASEYLHSLGIRGIKYADGSTRHKENQNFNYVIFNDEDVSITMKFSAVDAAKSVNSFFKGIPYGQILTDLGNKAYRFLMPVDRAVTLSASQNTFAPIKSLLNQFVRQRKEKAGRVQSDMTDGAHIWKRFEKHFKTDAEIQNFTDMVWNATEYELHADGAASGWTEKSWEEAGMLERTGKSLGEAKKIVSDQYKKLSPEQKIVHQEMLHHVQQMYLAGRQAELAWLDQAEVKKAETWLLNEEGEKPELADLVKEVNEHYPTLRGDYMPLMRFGNLIVRTYEQDEHGELGARTHTEFFDSPQAAKAHVEAVNKTPGKHAKIETNPEYRKDVVNIPASLVDKISKAAEKLGITGEALEDLKQSIEGIRANMLPRNSIASSKLHREGVAGYEKDVIRVYLTYVRNHALANAQLTHGAKIEQTFRDMRNTVDAISSKPDYDVDAVRRMSELTDHLYDVEKSGSREKVNEFTKMVGKITFMWYLSSPSVFAVQWSQPFMVTIPKMGARHGFGKAFSAYTQAAKRFLHGDFSDDKIDAFDRSHEYVGQRVADLLERSREAKGKEREDLDKELKAIYDGFKDPNDRRLLILKVLSHQGQIDLAMSHNAQDIVAGAKAGDKVINNIVDKAAFFMQKSETGSRRAAAVAAFELQFKGANFTEANDYATHIISDTLMDFDAQNRGAAWRGNTGRIIGQFQFFRMHMVGKLVQLTKDAIGGEYKRALAEAKTQEEKDAALKAMHEARKELAYVMGSSFALAGAAGTPLAVLLGNTGMSALWGALAFLFGDDDDPWDPQREFELAVRESLGDTAGGVVLKGLPSLIGADISRRIGLGGMGDIIQGDPPAGLTGTAKANWYAGRILGPSWGMVSDTMRASDALAEGDLAMAVRYSSPKVMRDVVKMFNVADEGVKGGGKTLVKPEDVSVWSMALMLSGVNPTEVSLAQDESRYLKNISTELSQRRSMLIRHLAEATVDQDFDAKESAIEKINAWSEKQPMLKITQQEVVQKIKKVRDGQAGKLSKREQLIQDEFGKK